MSREARWFWLVVLTCVLGAMAVHWDGFRTPDLGFASSRQAELERISAWLEHHPGDVYAHIRRGDLWLERDNYEAAAADFRVALEAGCQDPTVLNNMAWSLAQLGRYEEARPLAEQSVRSRREAYALDTLAVICASLDDHDRARELFAEALRLEPDNEEIRNHRDALLP